MKTVVYIEGTPRWNIEGTLDDVVPNGPLYARIKMLCQMIDACDSHQITGTGYRITYKSMSGIDDVTRYYLKYKALHGKEELVNEDGQDGRDSDDRHDGTDGTDACRWDPP